MKNKKYLKVLIVVTIILILLAIILFLLFGRTKGFTIVLDTDGGSPISDIEVKDGEIVKLPDNPTKEGYIFSGWADKNNHIITNGTKINENITIKALWIDENMETITTSFDSDGGNIVGNIITEKGSLIKLPVDPTREGYVFAGWIDDDGNIISDGIIITSNINLKALWIDKNSEIVTIHFDSNGGNVIVNIIVEKGKIVRFPLIPVKTGFVFAGWIDENGNTVTKDTIVTNNINLKAIWKDPYTCPDDCTPIGDGSTCSKEVTTKLTTGTGCPSGYTLKENQCLDLKTQYDRDADAENPRHDYKCLSDEGSYAYIFGLGAQIMCAKKTNKITTSGCPKGYTKDGDICKKIEVLKCKTN